MYDDVYPLEPGAIRLIRDHGELWEIQHREGAWSATHRFEDGHRVRVIAAHTAAQLADRLDAAEAEGI
jgi:hypothetical protein